MRWDIFLCDSERLQGFPLSFVLPPVGPCNCAGFHTGRACSYTLWFVEQVVSTYGVCVPVVLLYLCAPR